MKYIKNKPHYLLWILLLAITFSSCESALDKFPKDSLYPEDYFKTEEHLRLYSNKFYPDNVPGATSIYNKIADDVIQSTLPDEISNQRQIEAGSGSWKFNSLRNMNYLLEMSENCLDTKARNRYDGLARFFRAYFYSEKMKRFGEVPFYDKAMLDDDPDLYKGRDTRDFLMDKILEDLDFAIENLPTQKMTYEATKWTALALKSRACLFEGTFRKYHGIANYEKYLKESVDAAEKFIAESPYGLYTAGSTPYQDLFAVLNARSEEIILARDYDATLGFFHSAQNSQNTSSMGRPGLTKTMVNTYLMNDGTRFTDKPNYQTMPFWDECKNRDPRLAQTIRTPGYKRMGETQQAAPDLGNCTTGYHPTKYSLEPKYDGYNKSFNDMPIFRTAEVYLNFAEAKAELETLTQADIDKSIKKLRDRVNMPNLVMASANASPDPYMLDPETGYPNVTGANAGVILEIRRERTIELVMEGFRYYDVIRWKAGKRFDKPFLGIYINGPGSYDLNQDGVNDVIFYTGSEPSGGGSILKLEIGSQVYLSNGTSGNIIWHQNTVRKWDEDKDYLYPIPTKDRILTNGAITQNPGWDDGLNFN